MNAGKLLVVSVLTLLLAAPACNQGSRSAGAAEETAEGAGTFDRASSTGLFVGINRFDDQTLVRVEYAVDDAVDLAWNLALNPRIALVPPRRVVLALSGSAHKKESKDRLAELKRAGAVVRRATRDDIAEALQQQAAAAGKQGLFIAALATHGYSDEGVPYVLASSSMYGVPETALSTAKVFEIAADAGAQRSLIFVDACRERLKAGSRTGEADPHGAAAMLEAMGPIEGQAVFFAAAAGKYAYDDRQRQNGVFSSAVLDGLRCEAPTDARGFVTVDTLSAFVEQRVRNWIMIHRRGSSGSATQTNIDGATKDMPLVQCKTPHLTIAGLMPSNVLPSRNPDDFMLEGTSLKALGKDRSPLWTHDVGGRIADAEVVDLDGDGLNEVVLNTGRIIVLNAAGEEWWRSPADPRLGVTSFITANLFRNGKQEIVAISAAADGSPGSRLTIFYPDGKNHGEYPYAGRLQSVAMGKATSHHWPRLVVSGLDDRLDEKLDASGPIANVFLLNPNKLVKPLWSGALLPQSQRIEKVEIVDYDNDSKRDIAITTTGGSVLHLDFTGGVLSADREAKFILLGKEVSRQATIGR
ncbi:MAG TPA: caspase family protein [Thermoanaerobaculia bacterium]|nr:caspase family protein [Thermoanaerobaculia bacterium]